MSVILNRYRITYQRLEESINRRLWVDALTAGDALVQANIYLGALSRQPWLITEILPFIDRLMTDHPEIKEDL